MTFILFMNLVIAFMIILKMLSKTGKIGGYLLLFYHFSIDYFDPATIHPMIDEHRMDHSSPSVITLRMMLCLSFFLDLLLT